MKKTCPFLKDDCIGEQCELHTHIRGTDKNTGVELDKPGCALGFLPLLLIENTQASREVGAAIESARNETVQNHLQTLQVLQTEAGAKNGVLTAAKKLLLGG